jgi:hypothetical protein
MDKKARIRQLNDAFRQTFVGGRVLITPGVSELVANHQQAVLAKVRTFDSFDGDNDPHHEHDFVDVEHEGTTYFGKIDYYAHDLQHGSDDPADPDKTVRVLTIMRADEY